MKENCMGILNHISEHERSLLIKHRTLSHCFIAFISFLLCLSIYIQLGDYYLIVKIKTAIEPIGKGISTYSETGIGMLIFCILFCFIPGILVGVRFSDKGMLASKIMSVLGGFAGLMLGVFVLWLLTNGLFWLI
jgi:hypothetical protein